jgi:EAL domain-containing protein (putative c-di-GMP-specific phosphodiesterase class I)
VIAEGVETREQLEMIAFLGCEHFQGFYCSPPVEAAELPARIGDWGRSAPAVSQRRRELPASADELPALVREVSGL